MTDITMCTGEGCERKEYCHRYTAEVNPYWQAFFTVSPLTKDGCEMFLNNDTKDFNLRL